MIWTLSGVSRTLTESGTVLKNWPRWTGCVTAYRVKLASRSSWGALLGAPASCMVTVTFPDLQQVQFQPEGFNEIYVPRPKGMSVAEYKLQHEQLVMDALQRLMPLGSPLTLRVHPAQERSADGELVVRADAKDAPMWKVLGLLLLSALSTSSVYWSFTSFWSAIQK